MITTSTEPIYYWGVGGEYGPFREQQTGEWAGWPDFGQVMRYFREKAKMKPSEFAELYGRETKPNGGPITARQVQRMELENQVPIEMDRRKIIVRLLNIPPMLLGLATLENVTLRPHPEVTGATIATGQTTSPKVKADTSKYQINIRTFVALHYTSQAQDELNEINADIRDLESLESQSRGDLRLHFQEILFSYHLLAAKVVRDQRNFSLSSYYANQAVRVAKATQDTDLIATAKYTRGRTYLEWGMYGSLGNSIFQVQVDKINNAIRDFEDAKKATENTDKSLHPQIIGLIDAHLSRAYAVRSVSLGEKEAPAIAFTLLDGTEENADKQPINDPFEREIVTGSQIGFVKGDYHLNKAKGLTIMGRPGAALTELTNLESLRDGRIGRQFTRNQVWLDIVAADVYMGLEQFDKAAERATRAIVTCRDINSLNNLAGIVDIHGRLLQSSYKNESDVEELGKMVNDALIKRI